MVTECLSPESASAPSESAVPESVSGFGGPVTLGTLIVRTSAPLLSSRSSMKIAAPALVSAVLVPSPTRAIMNDGTQDALASQWVPPFWLQAVPTVTAGLVATPPVQTSCVQVLPSAGTSVSFTIDVTVPMPSHTFEWQSPAVVSVTAVFAASGTNVHAPATQRFLLHAVSWVLSQFASVRHCTQVPAPSHSEPPLWVQPVPLLTGGFEAAPLVHRSCVH